LEKKVSIIGAGSWGTTLGVVLSQKGINVVLHSFFKEENLCMQQKRENPFYLKGVKFPPLLEVNPSLKEVLKNKIIIIAVPVKFVRNVLKKIRKTGFSFKDKIFVSVSKGIEEKSLKRVSQIIKEELKTSVAVLSGPTIAKEVLEGIPTTCIIASYDINLAKKLQVLFNTPTFRVYIHQDVIGVELGGALKNIIAIACGISDGLGFGTNTKAAIVNRGLVEISRLGRKLGAKVSTFWGLAGLGDLITTCFSSYSRNRFVGEEIGKGKKLKDILNDMKMIAEGVETVKSAYKLSKKFKIEMPITEEVYKVLYKNKPPEKAVKDLMTRPLKKEIVR
jgi:glycerol-3-phosphate dehydrogenase (NAD(P)+)